MLKTLFLNPPSFEGFDGGAGSRYQARREIRSFWYPTWLAQPAACVPGSKLIDAPPHGLSMQAVVEVHSEEELDRALRADAGIIGINNRDLSTMTSDRQTTARLRPLIPAGRVVISESGIGSRADVDELRRLGVDAVLVGESLLRAADLDAKVRELSGS